VILQALAIGTPVVGFNVGGIPELVRNGETGRLVPLGDSAALAEAILAALREPGRARAMASGGQAMTRAQYTFDAAMARTTSVYRTLLDG
jgi:starch synthase